jgi:TolB-like protein/class 3 adenylate cyclase
MEGDPMAAEDFKRKLSAILSADVKEYSRLMRDDEDATIRTLTAYRAAIAKLVQQYRGRVVDSPGDNVLAEFGSVVDAVNCAVEIQRELAERNAELQYQRRMEFRIGINSGDVVEEGDRIYGDGVNIAARVEGLAEGGGICISGNVHDSIEGKLGLEFEYLGEHEVKNIDKPITVYRVLSFPGAAAHRVVKAKSAMKRRWREAALAIAAMVIVVVGALAIWNFYFRPPPIEPASVEKMAFPLPDKPSIAVLPFDNMSKDPELAYFSDAITENIITSLAKIPDLFVISRHSTFTYKGKSVKVHQVAEDMGVQYVLGGSALKSEDRVRVTAQLIDALSGKHLWAERYDRKLKDIFAIQDDITKKIVAALQLKLTVGEAANALSKRTDNLQAYLSHMKGLSFLARKTIDDNVLARQMCEEAIALDPEYVGPYVTLAWTHLIDVHFGVSKSPKESLMRAAQLAKKALTLDESYSGTHTLLSSILLVKREYDKAIAEAEKGIDLIPNNATAHAILARVLLYAGRFEESIHAIKKAIRLSPIPPRFYFLILGGCYLHMGRNEEALAEFKKVIKHNPDDLLAHVILAVTYSLLGRETEARTEVAEVLRLNPEFSLKHIAKNWPYKNRDDLMRIINSLRKAGLK